MKTNVLNKKSIALILVAIAVLAAVTFLLIRVIKADVEASTTGAIEVCDNRIDDNGDGRVDGCWDPGSNYQPTGTIYYVAANGNDSNNGSEAYPFKTFNKAASVAKYHSDTNKSDAIYVKSGTYSEPLEMQYAGTSDKPIVVRGVGSTKPIIRVGGGNVGHIVAKSNTIIDNFETNGIQTVTSAGHGLGGYGIFLSNVENVLVDNVVMQQHEKGVRAEYGNRLIVRNSLIKNCEWGTYIGTDNDNGFSPEFNNTLWENVEAANTAWGEYYNTDGFLIEGYSAYHVFRNCKSHGWTDAGFDLKPHVLVENSVAYDNSWTNGKDNNGHGFKIWRDGVVRNSIAYNNKLANFLYGGYLPNYKMIGNLSYNGNVTFEDRPGQSSPNLSAQSIKISHNIFLNSGIRDEIGEVTGTSALRYAEYNLFYGGDIPSDKGVYAKTGDPMVANIATKDFRLLTGSPAIDGGALTVQQFMSPADFLGNSRKIGSAVDIGPYEQTTSTGTNPSPQASPNVSPIVSVTPSRTFTATAVPSVTSTQTSTVDTTQNNPPVINDIPPKAVYAGRLLYFRVYAKDPEGSIVKYKISLPNGETLSSRTFSWTPKKGTSGSYTAIVKATDNQGAYSEKTIDIKVLSTTTYAETRWLNVENKVGSEVSFQVCRRSIYTDLYREVITFSDGSDYLYINEPGRSACTNFYTHQYKPGYHQMTLYLCKHDSSGNITTCFPNIAKTIKK